MSSPTEEITGAPRELPNAADVAAYLRENPEYLRNYPDVLAALEIDHSSGAAVSLVERQVVVLREENARIKRRFQELVGLAQSNEQLIKRVHQLALSLMEAAGPRAIFATLSERLGEDFGADHVRAIIFSNPSLADVAELPEFVGRECAERAYFTALLETAQPACTQLSADQARFVMDTPVHEGSTVLIPLSGKSWDGVLGVSSEDPQRFNAEMGTEYLAYIGDIVSLIVDPWTNKGERA